MEKTIAVLPFVNMSADPAQSYFSDGITEEIINALASIEGLKVTSRTSSFFFKDKDLPLREIASQLKVAIILEGSVRLAGDTLRITAQLIQAEDDFHFWSERWDRPKDNILEVQDEISLLIADKLREQLGHFELEDTLKGSSTANASAYDLALQARFHQNKWNPQSMETAVQHYKQALELDNTYAEAHVGLADCYSFFATTGFMPFDEAWDLTETHIDAALKLDKRSGGAYYLLGNVALFRTCDFALAVRHIEKATILSPNFADARQFLALFYMLAGQTELARHHLDIARSLNPLSQETLFYYGHYHYWTGDYTTAITAFNACLDHNPLNIPALTVKCYCLIKMGRLQEVETLLADMPQEISIAGNIVGISYLVHLLIGDENKTSQTRASLEALAAKPEGFQARSHQFMAYGMMGQADEAFAWLEQAFPKKESLLFFSFGDPLLDPIKTDSRYKVWQRRIFALPKRTPHSAKKVPFSPERAKQVYQQLLAHMDQKAPHIDPELSLQSLSGQLDIHPNHLSWLLNSEGGQNFNAFINRYRVHTFQQLVRDQNHTHLSLIGLAYESGFNSKTVFNTYFKRETGMTPSQFLKSVETS